MVLGIGSADSGIRLFEIRLDDDHLFLRGSGNEASGALLQGKIVLCITAPLRIHNIRVRFRGHSRIWYNTTIPGELRGGLKPFERIFFDETIVLEESSKTIPPGNYEYDFHLVLPGDLPESLEGMKGDWITHTLKATIDRGRLTTNNHQHKLVHILRTLDSSSLELAHTMISASIWPGKVDYQISTPSKGVVFGSQIPVQFILIPLLKGLKVQRLKMELVEHVTSESPLQPARAPSRRQQRQICEDRFTVPSDVDTEEMDGRDGYRFIRYLAIPRDLTKCSQNINCPKLTIVMKHEITYAVSLLNPDGHVSEIRGQLPVHIYMAPHLRINDRARLVNSGPHALVGSEVSELAPPKYGEHEHDTIYGEVDPSGFMTPAINSGTATPPRRPPNNNASSGDALDDAELNANTLANRLDALVNPFSSQRNNSTGNNHGDTRASHGNLAASNSGSSTPLPRATSYTNIGFLGFGPRNRENSAQSQPFTRPGTPEHFESDEIQTSRPSSVPPSYETASHAPAIVSNTMGLPTYQQATSRPPSPVRRTTNH